MRDGQLRDKISEIVETDFEKALAESSIGQLDEIGNKLRVNNFAYSLRELTRHVLERLAPDDSVRDAVWYKVADPSKPTMITRAQRIKYAIQKGLSDDYLETLGFEADEAIKDLKSEIDNLSKYTHVNESTFDCTEEIVEKAVKAITAAFTGFVDKIKLCKNQLELDIEHSVDEEIINKLFFDTLNDIDWLATHYEVKEYSIDSIRLTDFDNAGCRFKVEGTIHVRLQYGSDGDMKRDDGFDIYKSFPFSTSVTTTFENGKMVYETELNELDIDTDSYWE